MGSPFFFRWNLAALPKSSASGVLALVSLVWKDEFHELDFFNIIQFVRNSSGLIFFRISKSPSSQISNTPTNSNLYLNTVDFLRVKNCATSAMSLMFTFRSVFTQIHSCMPLTPFEKSSLNCDRAMVTLEDNIWQQPYSSKGHNKKDNTGLVPFWARMGQTSHKSWLLGALSIVRLPHCFDTKIECSRSSRIQQNLRPSCPKDSRSKTRPLRADQMHLQPMAG